MRGVRTSLTILAGLIVVAAAAWLLFTQVLDGQPAIDARTGTDESLEVFLKREATRLSKELPLRTDAVTTWQTVTAKGHKLTFGYVLDVAIPPAERPDLLETIRPEVTSAVCDDGQVHAVLELGAVVIFVYFDANGDEAARLSFDLASCSEQ